MLPLDLSWLLLAAAPLAAAIGFAFGGPSMRGRIKWGAFCLIVSPVALLVLYRRLRGRTADGEPPGAAAPPTRARPVPVQSADDAALSDLDLPIRACPDCGFLGIRPPGVQDGVWPGGGELVFQVCPRCGYRGLPIEFAARADYATFLRELAAPREAQQ